MKSLQNMLYILQLLSAHQAFKSDPRPRCPLPSNCQILYYTLISQVHVPPSTAVSHRKIAPRTPEESKWVYTRKKQYNLCSKCHLPIYRASAESSYHWKFWGHTYCPHTEQVGGRTKAQPLIWEHPEKYKIHVVTPSKYGF